ncbi:MAG: carboxypeptidase regulatory-like domain-containing protein [Deltaproteobacteria bacterium]|nr:carboxypeptidase regulatory-like domain-containing protein [Deltaproteobacteria bacterium]
MIEQLNSKAVVVMLAVIAALYPYLIQAQERAGVLQGIVKNSSGTPLSGAFVRLKNAERRLTFMVITQEQGRYRANNLPNGKYIVQAVGGDYQSAPSAPVDVAAGRPATVDLSLTTSRAPQLPGAWPGRRPGERGGEAEAATRAAPILPEGAGKQIVETKCAVGCHDAQRLVRARYNRGRWEEVIRNMRLYAQGSTLAKDLTDQEAKIVLDYLAMNLSPRDRAARPKPDPNSRLPRTLLQPVATKYIAVEYELPIRDAEPHEVAVDSDGNGWVSQRRGGHLGRLDPKTLVYTDIAPPPAASKFLRLNGIRSGPNNKLWVMDGGPNRRWLSYDTRAKEFSVFELPKTKTGNASGNTMRVHPNGTVWLNSIAANQVIRLDPRTREFTFFDVPSGVKAGRTANPYGMAIAADGMIWFAENTMNMMGRIDPVTGKIDEFEIPVKDAVPRKMGTDAEGNIWVGLHGAGKLMKIDYKTAKMTLYTPPSEDSGLYLADVDLKHNLIWVSLQHVDKIARFDPKSETWVEFPLASAESDARRIEVDQNNPNRVWWSGNLSNRMGYIELVN